MYCMSSFWGKLQLLRCERLKRYLVKKIEQFSKCGLEFSHVCELKITFIAYPRFMTYDHCLKIPNINSIANG